MNIDQLIGRLKADRSFMDCVTEWRTLPASEGRYEPLLDEMDPRLREVLAARGIHRLYCHQAECFRLAREGRDFVVVTPTASGKTLCYNLPSSKILTRGRCITSPPRRFRPIRSAACTA